MVFDMILFLKGWLKITPTDHWEVVGCWKQGKLWEKETDCLRMRERQQKKDLGMNPMGKAHRAQNRHKRQKDLFRKIILGDRRSLNVERSDLVRGRREFEDCRKVRLGSQ